MSETMGKASSTTPIEDPLKIRQALTVAQENNARILMKVDGAKELTRGAVSKVNFTDGWLEIKIESGNGPETGASTQGLLFLRKDKILGLVLDGIEKFIPEESSDKKVLLRCRIPDTIYSIQRRKSERYEIPAGYELKVRFWMKDFPGQPGDFFMLDISVGGFSFLIPESLGKYFSRGLILPDVEFSIRGQIIKAAAEVQGVHPARPEWSRKNPLNEPGKKVGVKFHRLNPNDATYIAQYVYEHRIQYHQD